MDETEEDAERTCDHSEGVSDEVYWKWVNSDGWCLICGEFV